MLKNRRKDEDMMRKELYDAVKSKITADVPEVKHVDLWNHNVEFIEQEESWDRPAVFVEFGSIEWSPYVGGGHRGSGVVRLHIVTDWIDGGQDEAWSLGKKLYAALEGLSGESFGGMILSETATNHNHEDILESIDTYSVKYLLTQ